MLGILLKILSVLGWFLLAVLILLLFVLLLVLIYPISYRLWWEKTGDNMLVRAKASWLLGLFKVNFEYPKPGTVIIKVLGFTVFDSGKQKDKADSSGKTSSAGGKARKNVAESSGDKNATVNTAEDVASEDKAANVSAESKAAAEKAGPSDGAGRDKAAPPDSAPDQSDAGREDDASGHKIGIVERILTIPKNIILKIKQIYQMVGYYLNLLKEEDTRQLFSSVLMRSGKILKSIRPRKIKGRVLLGTGSPDTTGYAMAVYGMLSPYLGQNLILTPDFEEKVLEGQLLVKGRIMVLIPAVHGLRVGLDRRLHSFIKKLKREVK